MKAIKLFHHMAVFILLLYETTCFPADWTTSALAKEDPKSAPSQVQVVPVWARKAGFHLKSRNNLPPKANSIQEESQSETKDKDGGSEVNTYQGETANNNENQMPNHNPAASTDSITTPSKKEKVKIGEKYRGNRHKKHPQQALLKDKSPEEAVEEQEDEEDEYDYEEEKECPENQFYHIRGKRCVPIQCRGGSAWRDVDTGECILRQHRGKWRKKYSKRFGLPSRSATGLANGRWVSG